MIIIRAEKAFHRVGEVRKPDYEVNLCVGIVNRKVAMINHKVATINCKIGEAEEVVEIAG